jgi:5-(hydroxymethyl)furfural/furfural oxidase
VLPYFKKIERDMDFQGPWHGQEGRIPVRRIFPDLWPEHAKAVGKAFEQAGWKFLLDQNAEWADGYFPITISNAYERRVSAAIGYLDPGTRMRDNLADTEATGLIFDGQRCVGVKALVAGRPEELRGREIILSCGAIHSLAHPMRAGIGRLRIYGARHRGWALPGVGQRLQDHPAVAVAAFSNRTRAYSMITLGGIFTPGCAIHRTCSGIPAGDMFTVVTNKTSWHAVGEQIGSFIVTVIRPIPKRGRWAVVVELVR